MKLPRWRWPLMIALLLVIVALVGVRLQTPAQAQIITCADPVSGCVFEHRGQKAQLRFSQAPRTLQPFILTVHAPNVRQIQAELQMQGMEMGPNRYTLTQNKAGVLTVQILLPVCVSGRRDWRLFLHIDAQRYAMPFSTS